MRARSLTEVLDLFARWGPHRYDEEVTQLEHALQTAALARQAEAGDPLVAAALLHDVGHLLELDEGRFRSDADRFHEARGASYLKDLFPPSVTRPIALHVRAKRHLCAVDPAYAAALSPGSTASLLKQGGPLAPADATAFAATPGGAEAIQLRRWDDAGKVPALHVGTLATHTPLLDSLLLR